MKFGKTIVVCINTVLINTNIVRFCKCFFWITYGFFPFISKIILKILIMKHRSGFL